MLHIRSDQLLRKIITIKNKLFLCKSVDIQRK